MSDTLTLNLPRLAGLVALIATVGLLVSASSATAATWGQYGPADPNDVTCRADRMDVTAPYIQPAAYTGSVGGWQYTAFISILKRWDPALRTWVAVYKSQPYFHKADWVFAEPEYFDYLHPMYGWRKTTQGHSIPMAGRKGYFTITFEFYWFDMVNDSGTSRVLGQRDLNPIEVFDERSYPFERNLGYCLY